MSTDNAGMMGVLDIDVPGAASTAPALDDTYQGGIDMRDSTRSYRKAAIPLAERRKLARRYGEGTRYEAQCAYCDAVGSVSWHGKSWVTFQGLEIDHIHPEFHGGTNDAENLTLACRPCNRRKGAKIL